MRCANIVLFFFNLHDALASADHRPLAQIKQYPDEYLPIMFGNCGDDESLVQATVGDRTETLTMQDTAGYLNEFGTSQHRTTHEIDPSVR